MKLSVAALLALPAMAAAFSPSIGKPAFTTQLSAKGAASKEEDLEMTRKLILDFIGQDPSEEEAAPAPKAEEKSEE